MRARRRVRRVGAMRQSATRSIRGPSLRARACGGAHRAGASSRSDVASPAVRTRVSLQSSGWLFIPAERSASRRCKHAMCKRARSVIGDRSHSPIPAAERTGAAAERTASVRSIGTFTMRPAGRPRDCVRHGACIASAGYATFSWPARDDDESGSRSMRRAHAATHRIERVDPHRADAGRRA